MDDVLAVEVELISSSLLPKETLEVTGDAYPFIIDIRSEESDFSIQITVNDAYPKLGGIGVVVKGKNMGRDEAEGWKGWASERLMDWNDEEEYPLYQILTTHFLPLLAPPSAPSSPVVNPGGELEASSSTPHHVLLTSHHLIAPSKRKDLVSLSSQLSLSGFAKTGHPGIIYAVGERDDLVEWLREVKSWQWLALRARIAPEPLPGWITFTGSEGNKGKESGARGGKGRGEWLEVEKVGEAVEWMKDRGRERLLTDLGLGVA